MNKVLIACTFLNIFQFSCSYSTQPKSNGEKDSLNKTQRNIEPFTTILLNNESFSIAEPEYLRLKPNAVGVRGKGLKKLGKFNHLKVNNGRHFNGKSPEINPHQRPAVSVLRKDVDHKSKILPNQHQDKVVKYLKNAKSQKKKIRKRHFERPVRYYVGKMSDLKRYKLESNFGTSYRYVLTEATRTPTKRDEGNVYQTTARNFGGKSSTNTQKQIFDDLNVNPWQNAEHLITSEISYSMNVRSHESALSSSLAPTWIDHSTFKQHNTRNFTQNIRNFESLLLPQNTIMNSYMPDVRSTSTSWLTTTAPSVQTATFHQADIIQRNLAAVSKAKKYGKNEMDLSPGDE